MKAIIFSFDSVLCDVRSLSKNAAKAALREHGYSWNDELTSIIDRGSQTTRWLDYAARKRLIKNEDIRTLEASQSATFVDSMSECVFPERNFKKLEDIKNSSNVKISLVGDSNKKAMISFLKWTRLNEIFDHVTSYEDVGYRRSPDPSVYLKAIEKLDLSTNSIVCVEGSYAGGQAATSAGLSKIFESSPYRLDQTLYEIEKSFR